MRWLPLVQVNGGVAYLVGLAEVGNKLHIGPEWAAEADRKNVAFCGREFSQSEAWNPPLDRQREAWLDAMRNDMCGVCVKAWLALEAEIQGA